MAVVEEAAEAQGKVLRATAAERLGHVVAGEEREHKQLGEPPTAGGGHARKAESAYERRQCAVV